MTDIKTLSIDIETYSSTDLSKCGVYRYAESPDAELLLFGCSVNGGPAAVYAAADGEEIPAEILAALSDESVTKWAFNANFERVFLSLWLRRNHPLHFKPYGEPGDTNGGYLSPASWRCSMAWSAYMGLPLSLAGAGAVLGLREQKLAEGRELVRYFCTPCRPTKANGGRTRNLPRHDAEKWELFKRYNRRDVEAEAAVRGRLAKYPVPEGVWEEYRLDQEINDRGIALDAAVVENAILFDGRSRTELMDAMKAATGLDNPNSVAQMKKWLADNGTQTESLGKKDVARLIPDAPDRLKEALKLRQKLARSSVKKYRAMQDAACADGRARGMFQFYGASRSGRWAGRLIQLQNLPQNHMGDLAEARALLRLGDYEGMSALYDDIPDTLSQLIRTAFIPEEGRKLIVADFSAIEARVLSHLAGEAWRAKVFAEGGDIYCASASRMFHVPVEKNGAGSHLRQKGKIAELALGYGGSVGALKSMGALEMGLSEEELQPLVDSWRATNPNIVRFWRDIDDAAKAAIRQRTRTSVGGILFTCRGGLLLITLPSGRSLSYIRPETGTNRFGGTSITYEGIGAGRKWERIASFGAKLSENISQAVSRDILAHAMKSLRGCRIVAHVHDEIILSCGMDASPEAVCRQMEKTPDWIPGLLLRAEGYEAEYYRKA